MLKIFHINMGNSGGLKMDKQCNNRGRNQLFQQDLIVQEFFSEFLFTLKVQVPSQMNFFPSEISLLCILTQMITKSSKVKDTYFDIVYKKKSENPYLFLMATSCEMNLSTYFVVFIMYEMKYRNRKKATKKRQKTRKFASS